MKTRTCTRCKTPKPLTEEFFKKRKQYAEGFCTWCTDCMNEYNTAYAKQDRLDRPEFFRARELAREMKAYGTTVEWYRDKLIAQKGLCAICGHLSHHHGVIQRLQMDHDHSCCNKKTKSCGKCLRGLLCGPCNLRLAPLEQTLRDALVFPMLGKGGSWTSRALRYITSYERTQHDSEQCNREDGADAVGATGHCREIWLEIPWADYDKPLYYVSLPR